MLVEILWPFSMPIPLNNRTSKQVIEQINQIFFKVEFPSILKCDNSFTSPRYPQSNDCGVVVKRVNERSYVIRDNFGNCFRRNRRLITRTDNINFNASDLLYEENVGGGDGVIFVDENHMMFSSSHFLNEI